VAVVDIDEASIGKVGQWPWPRTTIAELVDRLGSLGAAAVAFDMVFPEADRTSPLRAIAALEKAGVAVTVPPGAELDNDGVLGKAFARNPVVAGIAISNETQAHLPPPKAGFAFGGADPKSYLPSFRGGVANLPVLDRNAPGLGFFSFPLSGDGVVRSLPLLANAGGQLYPALAVEALRVAQGAGSFVVRSTGASGEADSGRQAMTALKVGALAMPTGPDGQFRVYYSGLPDLETIPAARLLDPGAAATLQQSVAGHVVLIGTSAVGLRDLVATPFQQAVAGVRVHAEIIDQIIGQEFLVRPDWADGAEILLAVVLGLAVLVVEWRTGALVSGLTALGLVTVALGTSWAAFIYGHLLINPIVPAGAILAVFTVTMPVLLLMADREKRFIRGAFAHYLSPALVGRLADNPASLRLGGEIRELTILFSDIRGFTSLSENLDPDALTRLLNGFLTPATDVLLKSEATIDKYIGDAIMAFWNAPLDIADHPRKACLAALRIQEAVEILNSEAGSALRVGLGLHTGQCCVGNLGSAQRFSYSAIGDSVNVA
uniref:CHASE2 domain-containing protein n=1 Tax=Mesorhizobium sp. TaxID=1871066 RepID=UPI0025E6916F